MLMWLSPRLLISTSIYQRWVCTQSSYSSYWTSIQWHLRYQILLILLIRSANNGPLRMCYRSLSECCTRSQHLQSLSLPDSPSSAPLEQQILAPYLPLSGRRTLCYIRVLGEVHVCVSKNVECDKWNPRSSPSFPCFPPSKTSFIGLSIKSFSGKERFLPY